MAALVARMLVRTKSGGIVASTLGRVHDMINRKALNINHIKLFCLDKAEMLPEGFKDQTYKSKYLQSSSGPKAVCLALITVPAHPSRYILQYEAEGCLAYGKGACLQVSGVMRLLYDI